MLDILSTSRTYNSVVSSPSLPGHDISLTMDGDDSTYFESLTKNNQLIEYNFVPPISI
jgi:hypothetical protein